jgi:hypothetical protein
MLSPTGRANASYLEQPESEGVSYYVIRGTPASDYSGSSRRYHSYFGD